MPNPTSKLNLVINGVTTQLDIHDANAVDLTSNQTVGGNKEFTGTTTAHDLVPSATDTYNFGSPTAQWNNAYIKSLTINGVVCGDILTHNASEFVDVSTAQTIGGVKTFSNGLFASKSEQGDLAILEDSSINSTNEDANGMPLVGHTNTLKIKGAQYNIIPCVLAGQVFTSGNTSAELRVYKYKDVNIKASLNIYYTYTNDRAEAQFINCHITTNISGAYNIGSYNRRFGTAYITALNVNGTVNGINPGALSLPSMSYISLDTTEFDVTAGTIGTFTPTIDGWAILSITQKNKPFGIWILSFDGTYRVTFQSVHHGDSYMIFALIPVRANIRMNIYCTADDIDSTRKVDWLRVFPCQGNV